MDCDWIIIWTQSVDLLAQLPLPASASSCLPVVCPASFVHRCPLCMQHRQASLRVQSTLLSCAAAMQGLEDPQLIFQAVPEGLSGRRFAPPTTGMRVHFLPRRARFAMTSSFASGTSGSGDSGNSGSERMLPLKLRHLLNLHGRSAMVSCTAMELLPFSGNIVRPTGSAGQLKR